MTELEKLAVDYARKRWPGDEEFAAAFDSFAAGYQAAVRDAANKAPTPSEAARRGGEGWTFYGTFTGDGEETSGPKLADAPPPPARTKEKNDGYSKHRSAR